MKRRRRARQLIRVTRFRGIHSVNRPIDDVLRLDSIRWHAIRQRSYLTSAQSHVPYPDIRNSPVGETIWIWSCTSVACHQGDGATGTASRAASDIVDRARVTRVA